jgi:hypothetical protein
MVSPGVNMSRYFDAPMPQCPTLRAAWVC